ncbi:PREDICTED: MND1-interacting protein 1-like [Tarenaya hassleriana]|uniref:MND1-interacting protein 1-like n=1 Tax=Tarenaya hassleriana TaxID=28532 RepID=UPI00053C669B|nr:PREDICTED: MND1-interacting protein 1-like [Tarenaya hassleriana]XP_010538370.1 PREDICTED: MND1-interacting protein 1-like [Tarenaya hassleriana]
MGCTVREKHVRPSRKTRSVKPEFDPCCLFDRTALSKSIVESSLKHLVSHSGLSDSDTDPGTIPMSSNSTGGYCTEDQLEDILLKHLEYLYNEAISKLIALGYEEDVALRAILSNGYCYGGMDVLTNIMHNSLAYLNSSSTGGSNGNNEDQSDTVFTDLRQLEEYSLAGMLYLLQQVKPHLSKGDAMWCLLMSELHVGRASTMDIPSLGNGTNNAMHSNVEDVNGYNMNGAGVMAPALCRFHGGWGFGNGGGPDFSANGFSSYNAEVTLQRDIDCPRKFNLSPSMKSLLKRNVAAFAAGFRAASLKHMQVQTHTSGNGVSSTNAGCAETCEQPQNSGSEESVSSVLDKFRDLNLDENLESAGEDQKDGVIVSLIHQIKDLEKQVKERKDWAHKKAMQAAQKVSDELAELKMLRSEREKTQRLKKGKQTLEDSTMKRLSEMENALRKASSQVDKANGAVRKLENENAEIRAEMEASKLSAAESLTACVEAAKKEKKCLKKLLAWEKQRMKLQDEITSEKEKIKALNRSLALINQEEKENEAKWRREQEAKEKAVAQVEEEQRAKEAAEASNKRRLESLRLKIEIDFQKHKDDLQRLEQELSRLKPSSAAATPSTTESSLQSDKTSPTGEAISRLLEELDRLDGSYEKEANYDRECVICMKDEVSIVFLPCAHQVICASCNDSFMGKKGSGKITCPCCRAPVHQRIRVFGATY